MSVPDVLIVGGGIIGLTAAHALVTQGGVRVTVTDRSDLGREASWAGAGIIPPGDPARAAHPLDRLRAITAVRLPTFSADLLARTGIDNGYTLCGGVEFLEEDEAEVVAAWQAEGIDFERLTPAEVRRRHPAVAAPDGPPAYHLPGMAQVRNPRHLRGLVAACGDLGVQLLPHTPVTGFTVVGDRITAAETPAGPLAAGVVLVAAGAWSDNLLARLGARLAVRPVRGQIVLFGGEPLFWPVLLQGKRYLVPRPDGRVLAGSTEEEAGFVKETTPEGVAGLTAFARRLVPGLADAPVERTWAGLRPGSPDGVPSIGRLPGWRNVFVAAGHFRAGVQLSVGTAELLADLILGRAPSADPEAFAPGRPPTPPVKPAFRS
jgi:glycine oxidase